MLESSQGRSEVRTAVGGASGARLSSDGTHCQQGQESRENSRWGGAVLMVTLGRSKTIATRDWPSGEDARKGG